MTKAERIPKKGDMTKADRTLKKADRTKQAGFWREKKALAARVLPPLLLLLLPLWNSNAGVDYGDTGYSLNNYANYASLGVTWKLSTYLSNCLGCLFQALPGGGTLLGMNLYTSLLPGAMAAASYGFWKKRAGARAAFCGEVLALCLCWCPTVILYNYLTYALMLAALLLLHYGLETGRRPFLAAAGALLGANVFVRFPNLAEAALILLVWYDAFLTAPAAESGKERRAAVLRRAAGQTGVCLAGYLAGYLAVFAWVCLRYGIGDYLHMLTGMSAMEESGGRYDMAAMLTGPFLDYLRGFRWLLWIAACVLAGCVLFRLFPGKGKRLKRLGYVGGMALLLRYFWGHAMFDLNYYSYGAVFWPTVLVLTASLALCIWRLCAPQDGRESAGTDAADMPGRARGMMPGDCSMPQGARGMTSGACSMTPEVRGMTPEAERRLAALVLLVLLITPLGSNNRSYPVMNNLFLVLPFTISRGALLWRRIGARLSGGRFSCAVFPLRAMAAGYALFFSVQVLLFGAVFTFGDGAPTQKRDAKIENNGILRGIRTTEQKARVLTRLTQYYADRGDGRELLCYGNIPALPYYLGAGTAIGSAWPDLATYAMEDYRADLNRLAGEAAEGVFPIVLLSARLDEEDRAAEKFALLWQFMEENGYTLAEETEDILLYDRTDG